MGVDFQLRDQRCSVFAADSVAAQHRYSEISPRESRRVEVDSSNGIAGQDEG
jgi:hypothetical protein